MRNFTKRRCGCHARLVIGALTSLMAVGAARADIPRLIHYQGKLRDSTGGEVGREAPAIVRISFRLEDGPAPGATLLFAEAHDTVTVTHGLFSLLIGSETVGGVPDSALDAAEVWLSVSIDDGPELSPRTRIASTSYAVKARVAERLVRPGTFTPSVSVDAAGNVGVGTTGPTSLLHLASDTDAAIRFETHDAFGAGSALSAGPNSPLTAIDDGSIGSLPWMNPSYAAASDNAYAAAAPAGSSENTHFLRASGLGFNIPVNAVIRGIEVAVERQGTNVSSPGSVTFNYTGGLQQWTVPAGVSSISVDARGARGANGLDGGVGGNGGRIQSAFSATPGEVLSVYVGGQGIVTTGGWNGGGNGGGGSQKGGGGGGASDIRRGGVGLGDRIVIAGGGGGGGWGFGGAGGDLIGATGGNDPGGCGSGPFPGTGGTHSGGGAGGAGDAGCGGNGGTNGGLGTGGNGGDPTGNQFWAGGGGGGGGYYGGGGGGAHNGGGGSSAGGGGGSSFSSGTGTTHTQGFQSGHGQIIISYTVVMNVADNRISIVRGDGSTGSVNKAQVGPWPASDAAALYGGAEDLWGEVWDPASVNDPDFGVVVSASVGQGATASVDQVTVRLSYTGAADANWALGGDQSDIGKFKIANSGALGAGDRLTIDAAGNVGIGTNNPAYPLHMASGAYVSAGGTWTNASSRDLKQDIQPLASSEAAQALARLSPVKFAYRADPADCHVGFIAEEAPDLIATPDHKGLASMDIVAVLTRVVQEQQARIQELECRLDLMPPPTAAP